MINEKLDWPALMEVGLFRLGLPVDEFWALTPNELMVKLGRQDKVAAIMTRDGLSELLAQFPDQKNGDLNG